MYLKFTKTKMSEIYESNKSTRTENVMLAEKENLKQNAAEIYESISTLERLNFTSKFFDWKNYTFRYQPDNFSFAYIQKDVVIQNIDIHNIVIKKTWQRIKIEKWNSFIWEILLDGIWDNSKVWFWLNNWDLIYLTKNPDGEISVEYIDQIWQKEILIKNSAWETFGISRNNSSKKLNITKYSKNLIPQNKWTLDLDSWNIRPSKWAEIIQSLLWSENSSLKKLILERKTKKWLNSLKEQIHNPYNWIDFVSISNIWKTLINELKKRLGEQLPTKTVWTLILGDGTNQIFINFETVNYSAVFIIKWHRIKIDFNMNPTIPTVYNEDILDDLRSITAFISNKKWLKKDISISEIIN